MLNGRDGDAIDVTINLIIYTQLEKHAMYFYHLNISINVLLCFTLHIFFFHLLYSNPFVKY